MNASIILRLLLASSALLACTPAAISEPSKTHAAPGAAKPAPIGAEPQSTTAAFGDWTLRCVRIGNGAEQVKSCEVVQSIQVEGQAGPLAQIAVGRVDAHDPLVVTLLLPTNIAIGTAPNVSMGDKDPQPVKLNWKRCLPTGCFSDVTIAESTLQNWRATTDAGRIQFVDGAGRALNVPMSFRGFAQALDALAKS